MDYETGKALEAIEEVKATQQYIINVLIEKGIIKKPKEVEESGEEEKEKFKTEVQKRKS